MTPDSFSSLPRRAVLIPLIVASFIGCEGNRQISIGREKDASPVGTNDGMPRRDAAVIGDIAANRASTGGASGGGGISVPSVPAGTAGTMGTIGTGGSTSGDAGVVGSQGGPDGQAACSNTTPGVTGCGPTCESCSTSLLVTGGTYLRSYDGVYFPDKGNPATVSSFRLDKYEVTVGRFRAFMAAAIGGWRPASGSGKHTHLNSGRGLADSGSIAGTFETGWNSLWNNNLSSTAEGWMASLPWLFGQPIGGSESLALATVNWYHAYAFCIWDGGFLPSEAEWNYAASGGSEQRLYPWSTPASSETIDCTYANHVPTFKSFASCSTLDQVGPIGPRADHVGLRSPKGDGKWGQSDLAGNVSEWTADWFVNYATPCVDCAYLALTTQPVSTKVLRGGSAASERASLGTGTDLLTSRRTAKDPSDPEGTWAGIRCARTP